MKNKFMLRVSTVLVFTAIAMASPISMGNIGMTYVYAAEQAETIEANEKIKTIDDIRPRIKTGISNGILTVEGKDQESGIKAFYINGNEFKDFTNDTLKVRLQNFDSGYEYFAVQAQDNAGNMSEISKVENPYFQEKKDNSSGTEETVLPEDGTATPKTNATAVVKEHVKVSTNSTLAEQKKAVLQQADSTQVNTQTVATENPVKDFYTIQTDNGKTFYLVIDRTGEQELVYFLTEISENDLLNVTENSMVTMPKTAGATEIAIEEATALSESESEMPVEEEPEEEKTENKLLRVLIWLVLGGLGFGIFYLFKPVKEFFIEEDENKEEEDRTDGQEQNNETGGEEAYFEFDQ